MARGFHTLQQPGNIRDLDLKVDSSPKGVLQECRTKATWTVHLFDHEISSRKI